MKKEKLIELIKSYNPTDEKEKCYKKQILSFIALNDTILREGNPYGHITTSSWIISEDGTKVLLAYHGKLDKWIQLGGHVEVGEKVRDAAKREAGEESGLPCIELLSKDIFDVAVHKIPKKNNVPEHYDYDISFIFKADSRQKITVSDESEDVKWVKLKDIEKYTKEARIMGMVDKTKKYMPSKGFDLRFFRIVENLKKYIGKEENMCVRER